MLRQIQQQNPPDVIQIQEKEIVVQTLYYLFHLHVETFQRLSTKDIYVMQKKIERNGPSENKVLYDSLYKKNFDALLEVVSHPFCVLYPSQNGLMPSEFRNT